MVLVPSSILGIKLKYEPFKINDWNSDIVKLKLKLKFKSNGKNVNKDTSYPKDSNIICENHLMNLKQIIGLPVLN